MYHRPVLALLLLLILAGVSAAQEAAETRSTSVQEVERRLTGQLDSIMFMIKLAGSMLSAIGIALAVWGVGSYRGMLKEIRERHEVKIQQLAIQAATLSNNLEASKELLTQAQESLGIHRHAAPAVILAQVEDSLAQEKPDLPKAVGYLSGIARDSAATADELFHAGLIARERLGSETLAKKLLALAITKEDAPELARAVCAELCAGDPNWPEHQQTIMALVEGNPNNEAILKAAANFYVHRQDWPGLEEQMRKAVDRAPWLASAHRCRARAAERMRKKDSDIVAFYEKAVECAAASRDDQAPLWYALYLLDADPEETEVTLNKAEKLLRMAVRIDPDDGRLMIELGKVLLKRGKEQEARQYLEVGIAFTSEVGTRRTAAALLATAGFKAAVPLPEEEKGTPAKLPG